MSRIRSSTRLLLSRALGGRAHLHAQNAGLVNQFPVVPRSTRWMNHGPMTRRSGIKEDILVSHRFGNSFVIQRLYSVSSAAEEEQESELKKKVGILIKLLAAVTITYVSFNMFPIMGDSLIWQSVALVRLEDPFMKRSGASRISMIATNDRRRKGFVEAGAVVELIKMLESAADDKTRVEAVKALVSLCECDVAVEALQAAGAEALLRSIVNTSSISDLESKSLILLGKIEESKCVLN